MSFNRLRGWVFDLDGTLTVHQHDFPGIRARLGVPAGQLILEHLASLPVEEAGRKRATLDEIERGLAGSADPADGALDLVESLATRGACIGVVTRNTRTNALASLARIGLTNLVPADNVIGRDDGSPKPSPQAVWNLAARWQLDVRQCVMIGDHRLDLETGRNAGVTTIHVDPTSSFEWPGLSDHCVASLTEILDHLGDTAT
jgi:HAD superfamily hydrolase (TIGR01509 family)